MSVLSLPESLMLWGGFGGEGVIHCDFVCSEQTLMHFHAAKKADVFPSNFNNPSERVDSRVMKCSE